MRLAGLELLTRAGFAARGLTYMMIGYLAVRSDRLEDGPGALDYLARGSGRLVVGLMALGFLSYGIWRLTDALSDTEGHGSDPKGIGARLGAAASGLAHLSLAVLSAMLAAGARSSSESGSEQQGAAAALGLPGGTILVGIMGAALLAVAIWQGVKAWRASFRRHLQPRARESRWAIWLGRIGYGSRALVFLGMAWFLVRAAWASDASQAGGLDDVLAAQSEALRYATAVGLFLFGVFSLFEARFREINERGLASSLQRLRAAVGA